MRRTAPALPQIRLAELPQDLQSPSTLCARLGTHLWRGVSPRRSTLLKEHRMTDTLTVSPAKELPR